MSTGSLITIVIVGLLCMALPFAAFAALRRRGLALRWNVFGIGAVTFLVAQIVLRLPWQIPLSQAAVKNGWTTGASGILFGLAAAFTAGLFEETGRFFAYRWFVKRPTKDDAVALGLGHGGFESVFLVGISSIATGVMLYLVANGLLRLPADQAAALQPMLDKSAGTVWYEQFVVLLERLSALCGHVAMSLLVYLAYVRRRWLPYFAALGVHVALDAVAALLRGHLALQETILALAGAVCLWATIRYWRRAGS
jgi:uncharacterized membrane protein YhfC